MTENHPMVSPYRPTFTLLNDDLKATIIEEAFRLLEEVGMLVEEAEATDLLLQHGAQVDRISGRILIPRRLAERALRSAPPSFHLYSVTGEHSWSVGGKEVHYDPGSAALKIFDPVTGRQREPLTEDLVRFHRLTERLEHLHFQSTGLVSSDVPGEMQDSYRLFIALQFCNKPVITGLFAEEGFSPMREMLEAVRGGSRALREKPLAIFDACPSAPLRWSRLTTRSVIECSRAWIPSEFIAVPLAGATGPVTLAGSLVQHAAENLAGITIAQLVQPGCPVVFGGSPAIFDMRVGNTPLGAIESVMLNAAHAEVGRALGLPTHAYLGLSDAKSPDAQAGLEAATGLLLAGLTGVNVVSGAGMLDFESCQSLEKLVIDNDACGMVYRLLEGIIPRDAPLGLEVIRDVGHQSGFLDHPHTRQWYRAEQSFPRILDRTPYDAWIAAGSRATATRAAERVRTLLEGTPEPLLDPVRRRMLRAIVADRARHLNAGPLPLADPEAEAAR